MRKTTYLSFLLNVLTCVFSTGSLSLCSLFLRRYNTMIPILISGYRFIYMRRFYAGSPFEKNSIRQLTGRVLLDTDHMPCIRPLTRMDWWTGLQNITARILQEP